MIGFVDKSNNTLVGVASISPSVSYYKIARTAFYYDSTDCPAFAILLSIKIRTFFKFNISFPSISAGPPLA